MTQDADVMDGTIYPKETMLAIAVDRATVKWAAQELRNARFAENDIYCAERT
jgi:hypothetical protein